MADNLQFPIQPVPSPEKVQPFQVPQVPDPSGIIMKAAELQQQDKELKQKRLSDLMDVVTHFAALGQKMEQVKVEQEGPKAILDLLLRKERLEKMPLEQKLLEAKIGFFGQKTPIGEEKRIIEQGDLNKFKGSLIESINTLKNFPTFIPILGKFGRQMQSIVSDLSAGQYAPALKKWQSVKPVIAGQARRLFAEKDARMSNADQVFALRAVEIEKVSPEVAAIMLGFLIRATSVAENNIAETRRFASGATPGTPPLGLSELYKTMNQKESLALVSNRKKTAPPQERYLQLESFFGENNDDMIVPVMTDEGYFVK